MSDEEDYASEDVLAQCLAAASSRGGARSSQRPSAPNIRGDATREERRKRELWKRQLEEKEKQETAKKAKLEKSRAAETRLEEGLNTAIEAENKGFQLLAKMGYKPGTTLGRQPDALAEPVKPVFRPGRSGLGKAEAETERQRRVLDAVRARAARREDLTRDYRAQKSAALTAKLAARDLGMSQSACRTQDERAGLGEPVWKWFWPPVPPPPPVEVTEEAEAGEKKQAVEEEVEEEEEEEPTDAVKLLHLTEYLRSEYFYCVWCGIKFESEEEMSSECPGDTRDDH